MARPTETIKALRGFIRGATLPPAQPGDVIDVSASDAATLIAASKAVRFTRATAEAAKPAAVAAKAATTKE